jgi:hypothetical protein
MTKIKNFRVHCRPREIARWLKKERGLEITPELEATIEELAKEAKKWVTPAAVYTTLAHKTAEKTTTIPFPPDAVAVSVTAVSIGPALEAERKAAAADPMRESLFTALLEEALTQAIQFTVRLIAEQAKEEDCELTPPVSVQEVNVASSLATLLGVGRIGVTFDASAPEIPPYARVSYGFWMPLGKGSASAKAPAGKSAGSAEKVAA